MVSTVAWMLATSTAPGWNFYDWLYNYEGGFIRRGLTGEILFAITDFTGISPVLAVSLLSLSCFVILVCYVARKFIKLGLDGRFCSADLPLVR